MKTTTSSWAYTNIYGKVLIMDFDFFSSATDYLNINNMTMTADDIIKILVYIVLGVLGLYSRFLFKKIDDLQKTVTEQQKQIQALSVQLPTEYVNKLEFSRAIDALFHKIDEMEDKVGVKLDRIYERLDQKADK